MDPFTKRMLEKAEQRSKILGISSADVSKFPVCDKNESSNLNALSSACAATIALAPNQQKQPLYTIAASDASTTKMNTLHVIEKNNKQTNEQTSQKVLRQFAAVNKENVDMGIEINILSDKNIEVQVQVEEEDISEEEVKHESNIQLKKDNDQPSSKIRDTSRNRLQRLGALYSNTDDLSSPIHRTEGKFHAESNENFLDSQVRKPNQRLGKLAALANTINQWEDDTSHHATTANASVVQPPPKPELKSRVKLQHEGNDCLASVKRNNENDKTKQLKWDSNVIDSLEAQGYQRRESSSVKVSYDFCDTKNDIQESGFSVEQKVDVDGEKRRVGKLNPSKLTSNATNSVSEKKTFQAEKKIPTVKTGLVSGRAAIFETQTQTVHQQQHKPQRDPTELSLKERMKLFEKNKGEALMPKAAFGMAPPLSKIMQDTKKEETSKVKPATNSNMDFGVKYKSSNPSTSAPIVRSFTESKVRDKVLALVNAATENVIKEDIKKQREEDLQLLSNRFNKQKDFFTQPQQLPTTSKKDENSQNNRNRTTPPPPPPMPVNSMNISSKRRSPGNGIDDDYKRPRTSVVETQLRLYPVLSKLEANTCSDSENENNLCTTASISAQSTSDEMKRLPQPLRNNDDLRNSRCDQTIEDDEDSYMESESDDSNSGICNNNLGRGVMQVVENNDKKANNKKEVHYAAKDHYFGDNTIDTSNISSDTSMGVDDYLDEALDCNAEEVDDEDTSRLSRDSKGTTVSNSFSFRKVNPGSSHEGNKTFTLHSPKSSNYVQPVKSELSVNKEDDNLVTLVHTVSFYRKQQNANSASSTPIRKVCREQQVLRSAIEKLNAATGTCQHFESNRSQADDDTESESEVQNENLAQEKIKKLLEEVCKQQQIIAQASQALNLCAATIEFSGSTESVEGERHLLVATHRRQACLDEVQRLRVEKVLRPPGSPREKGQLTIKDITIPLRQDYVHKLSSDAISGHHLVCLLKYNEHVIVTKTVPTLPGLLSVKFPDVLQLNNVYADFKITLEIYGMTAQREILPREAKYHINLKKKSGIKTPKKKASENRLVMPPVQSPAGPHAIRTPALVQYGFAIFSLREIQRTTWTLTQVLGVSPLDGIVHMKVNCELSVSVEHKGFLTMFEDVSGFGAWHRRWCYLNGTVVNYWKYPDDEKKKAPMGTIDLYTCSSHRVTIAPRDICARLNTMLLECERPAEETDEESLIIVPNGRRTTVRYLLSADTKDEREEWCAYFNKTLTLLRAWGPPQ